MYSSVSGVEVLTFGFAPVPAAVLTYVVCLYSTSCPPSFIVFHQLQRSGGGGGQGGRGALSADNEIVVSCICVGTAANRADCLPFCFPDLIIPRVI